MWWWLISLAFHMVFFPGPAPCVPRLPSICFWSNSLSNSSLDLVAELCPTLWHCLHLFHNIHINFKLKLQGINQILKKLGMVYWAGTTWSKGLLRSSCDFVGGWGWESLLLNSDGLSCCTYEYGESSVGRILFSHIMGVGIGWSMWSDNFL